MPKTFNGSIDFTTNFNVQTTKPLDNRLVVDSFADLTNGSIEAPYQGMVVNIAGTSELWILKTAGIANSHIVENWELVTGSGSGTSEEVEARIHEIRESIGVLTDIVGLPGTESDGPTGIFEEIENLKRSGSGLNKHTIPVMTQKMIDEATADSDIDFDANRDTFIKIVDPYESADVNGDMYLTMIQNMAATIATLQAEVNRLKNSFERGIYSYNDERTYISEQLGQMNDVEVVEPLWALDSSSLTEVQDTYIFNTNLGEGHTFDKDGHGNIIDSVDGQLTFDGCTGIFHDGKKSGEEYTDYTLRRLTDSKLVLYLVTDKPDVRINLVALDDPTKTKTVYLSNLVRGTANKYGFLIVLSRKVKASETSDYKGFNYVYLSAIDYETDTKLQDGDYISEGYVTDTGIDQTDVLTDTRVEANYRYSIDSLEFDDLTLYRMKFYTKYEDFRDSVIPSSPSEYNEYYDVAHIAIRSVKDTETLNKVANELQTNELIWNQKNKTLHIKSEDGKVYLIGSNNVKPDDDDNNKDKNMTDKQIIDALKKMGIIVNAQCNATTGEIESLENISMAPIADITFINDETKKRFTFKVDTEGNLVGKDKSAQTIEEYLDEISSNNYDVENYEAVRGFSSDYLHKKSTPPVTELINGVNKKADVGKKSDRLRFSSFYAPITTDESHGCTHSFIELENTSPVDIPLTGVYLHFFNPVENNNEGCVHHLELDGVIKAGGTYLIRGAKHAEFDDESAFIKVKTYDKEWYENGQPISFEQVPADQTKRTEEASGRAYRFCLTYGLADLAADTRLVKINPNNDNTNTSGYTIGSQGYLKADYPNIILNPRFIDSCSYSTDANVSKLNSSQNNPWYANGGGVGITIKPNTMFRLTFALDPAKQAFNGFNAKDSSRTRYNKGSDIQIVDLSKEFIGYPFSKEIVKLDRYTPKASFENKNVMTDKSQLNREKPNMVTCSFGNDVYNTRCFNWVSCGVFDEYVWIREEGSTTWNKFQSYKKGAGVADPENLNVYINGSGLVKISTAESGYTIYYTTDGTNPTDASSVYASPFAVNVGTTVKVKAVKDDTSYEGSATYNMHRKEYAVDVNDTVYARMINRFPGNDVLFTSHKCVVELPDATSVKTYEYAVGRPDKDGNPDPEHTNSIYTFTLYPRDYEGRLYQITDQQGFNWIEYQVWAAAAEFLNGKIKKECDDINEDADTYNQTYASEIGMGVKQPKTKVFPILLNTGDMTQSGARINEWLDYYNGGVSLFDHLEQMNCVGNNDLCPINPRDLGTGNDSDKSSSHFFHYFYCFDVKDSDMCFDLWNDTKQKFFSGETLVVKTHTGVVGTTEINLTEDKYIPSLYYFNTGKVMYVVVNSEIPLSNVQSWFKLCSNHNDNPSKNDYINIYTGIECKGSGEYAGNVGYFTPIYESIYAWLANNRDGQNRKVVVAMHEMPFTVITNTSLKNAMADQIPCTRNHPTNGSRLGSNVNQLAKTENRGIYWCSRLLEYFGCKLVIGGHKHTYALSYPIKEKYFWSSEKQLKDGSTTEYEYINMIDSIDTTKPHKPMLETLEDEAGVYPTNYISWDISLADVNVRNEYNITTDTSAVNNEKTLNSTKTPYIPQNLYNQYGKDVTDNASTGLFRCCTPTGSYNEKYDGFVSYSMCQATGYKLKSNKELPSATQVFSKIIPMTQNDDPGGSGSDGPSPEQLYPMYSILEFNDDCSELTVSMNRITGIFKKDGEDKFTQTDFGSKKMTRQVLCTVEKEDCKSSGLASNKPANPAVDDRYFATDENKIYKYTDDGWKVDNTRMYGIWLNEDVAKARINSYMADPTNVSDNRYLHIKF